MGGLEEALVSPSEILFTLKLDGHGFEKRVGQNNDPVSILQLSDSF